MDRQRRQPDKSQLSIDSIHEGRVVRIENYGAFVQIGDRRGLVHISQLASIRVEKVSDVVDLNESVWVKVIDIEQIDGREKIRLTMKNVPQDGTAIETQATERHAQGLSKGIEQSLNSTIGIAFARDPMAKSLILKQSGESTRLINGYALLEEEVEDEPSSPCVFTGEPTDNFRRKAATVKPMGRGRGATLPAWMMAGSTKTNPLDEIDRIERSKLEEKKKKKRKKEKKRESKKHSKSSKKKRSRSESPESERSREKDRKRRGFKNEYRLRASHSSDSPSSSERDSKYHTERNSRNGSNNHDNHVQIRGAAPFKSVEEAKRFVEEMEKRKVHGDKETMYR